MCELDEIVKSTGNKRKRVVWRLVFIILFVMLGAQSVLACPTCSESLDEAEQEAVKKAPEVSF